MCVTNLNVSKIRGGVTDVTAPYSYAKSSRFLVDVLVASGGVADSLRDLRRLL